ncbi:hypothetical protein B0H13DRAFT_1898376 [Mycena leptocephala]|nr:hypothetical protein B0H13DRAFT_1898376 [Mycena leptocephala]
MRASGKAPDPSAVSVQLQIPPTKCLCMQRASPKAANFFFVPVRIYSFSTSLRVAAVMRHFDEKVREKEREREALSEIQRREREEAREIKELLMGKFGSVQVKRWAAEMPINHTKVSTIGPKLRKDGYEKVHRQTSASDGISGGVHKVENQYFSLSSDPFALGQTAFINCDYFKEHLGRPQQEWMKIQTNIYCRMLTGIKAYSGKHRIAASHEILSEYELLGFIPVLFLGRFETVTESSRLESAASSGTRRCRLVSPNFPPVEVLSANGDHLPVFWPFCKKAG